MPCGQQYEVKAVVVNTITEEQKWEDGDNRVLLIPTESGNTLKVQCTWSDVAAMATKVAGVATPSSEKDTGFFSNSPGSKEKPAPARSADQAGAKRESVKGGKGAARPPAPVVERRSPAKPSSSSETDGAAASSAGGGKSGSKAGGTKGGSSKKGAGKGEEGEVSGGSGGGFEALFGIAIVAFAASYAALTLPPKTFPPEVAAQVELIQTQAKEFKLSGVKMPEMPVMPKMELPVMPEMPKMEMPVLPKKDVPAKPETTKAEKAPKADEPKAEKAKSPDVPKAEKPEALVAEDVKVPKKGEKPEAPVVEGEKRPKANVPKGETIQKADAPKAEKAEAPVVEASSAESE
eukprot:gene14448-20457_t